MNIKTILPLCFCAALFLAACQGGKSPATTIPEGSEAPAAEEQPAEGAVPEAAHTKADVIVSRVNDIYKAVAEAYPEINDITPSNDQLDQQFCTAEWQGLVAMVNEKDASDVAQEGFFEADYWIMAQDWGEISISDVSAEVKDDEHATATFTLHNLGHATKVRLDMRFENGEWLIANFIDESHKTDFKKGMIRHLEEKSKKEAEEKADDGIIEYDVP